MRAPLWLALAGLAVIATSASAQGSCEDIGRFFSKPPKIGEWADMRMDMKKDQGKKPMTMRVGFVGEEAHQGRQMYRLQMTMTGKDGQPHIMQMLTPWGPDALGREFDTEVVMKMGNQQAVIMPVQGDKRQMYDIRKECAKVDFVGEETVSVPAGSYKARHYKGPDGETWVSMDVPGWRMVKMVTKDGEELVLTGTGTGYKNEITEKPMDMKALMANPEAMKRMMEGNKQEAR
jgi:hypothetical protein